MDARQIARTRMRNLLLWGSRLRDQTDAVGRLAAMQAQEFPYARWSLGQRLRGVTDVEIGRLFDGGALLRTHLLRPTWHFVLPADIRWLLQLTGPRVKKMMASYDRQLELDERLYSRTNRLIVKWLAQGTHLTRKEIIERFRGAKIEGTGQRFGHIMLRAELEGLICSGATRGKQQTYALLDERAPTAVSLDQEDALAELTRRYFKTRGPATLKDYSWWSSLKMVDCRRGVEMLGGELRHREINERTYWFTHGTRPPSPSRTRVDLVQVYDECVVSYTLSRDALFDASHTGSPAEIAFYWHPILLDGQVAGQWRNRKERSEHVLDLFWFRRGREEKRALDEAVDRYTAFLGNSVSVKRVKKT